MENRKQAVELSDIFRGQLEGFLNTHSLCAVQQKAYKAIMNCRTSVLGGHIDCCDQCGYTRPAYNSCRNRHCPKCQFIKKVKWVDKLSANLPPVKHFHLVFTIPQCLNQIFYLNQKTAYDLLFKAVGNTLVKSAANPRFLGFEAGAVAILHTWGQTLIYHPHIHLIVPAGGLSSDHIEWIRAPRKFFLPVKALSAVFRGILCRLIEQAICNKQMILPDDVPDFKTIKQKCYLKNWVVYCEKPFSGPENLINYLGNYTHRVAISNSRIQSYENGKVTFTYKDNKDHGLTKTMTLDANEFIRRFMQHVLPEGFYKIRYFGFLALRNFKEKLELCFTLIAKASFLPEFEGLNALEVLRSITGIDPIRCPKCKAGTMRSLFIGTEIILKPG